MFTLDISGMLGNESKLKAWTSPAKIGTGTTKFRICHHAIQNQTHTLSKNMGLLKNYQLCFPNSHYKAFLHKYSPALLVFSHQLVLFKTCGTFTEMEKKRIGQA